MRLFVLAGIVAGLGLLAPPATADDPVVYTGCLKTSNGSLYNVREGSTPIAPCHKHDKQISWNMAGPPGPPGPAGPSVPQELRINVNCEQGESINAALAQQADRLIVSIRGTCVEGVVISRDDVTLDGGGTAAIDGSLAPAVRIAGGHRISLGGLVLTGGLETDTASFSADNLRIMAGGRHVALSLANSTGDVLDSEIANSLGMGVSIGGGSVLSLGNSSVVDNGKHGIMVTASYVLLGKTTVARNAGAGVYLFNSQATIAQSDILDPIVMEFSQAEIGLSRLASGLQVTFGSVALVTDATTVQGNLGAFGGSTVFLGDAVIDGGQSPGISLSDTSTAGGWGSVTVSGTPVGIFCAGPPSVAQLTAGLVVNGTTNCPPGGQ